MNSKELNEGNCAICGQFGKLTFEHIPPRSAFNDKPVYIQKHDHFVDSESYLFGKKSRSQKGFGGYTLCESCNNTIGDWCARDFGVFAHQGIEVIRSYQERSEYLRLGLSARISSITYQAESVRSVGYIFAGPPVRSD